MTNDPCILRLSDDSRPILVRLEQLSTLTGAIEIGFHQALRNLLPETTTAALGATKEEAAAAAESLEEQADQLTQSVAAFRISQTADPLISTIKRTTPAKPAATRKPARESTLAVQSSLNDEWQEF